MSDMANRDARRTLSPAQAGRVYDRIGRVQDWQGFYETTPIDDMVAHADFSGAGSVYELGCGTGALARRLLTHELDDAASYLGIDVSEKMVSLTTGRIAPWADRAEVQTVTGDLPLPGEDACYDRFVATYVFDLLDVEYAERIFGEARRLLARNGLLCLVSLTEGTTRSSRLVAGSWRWIWGKSPEILGGCRPAEMGQQLSPSNWEIVHHCTVTSWAVPSEVLVARWTGRGSDEGEEIRGDR